MNAQLLRQKYLEFFELKAHNRYPSGSLIPYDVIGKLDESLLFNGAGMVQFKPYFRGLTIPPNKRLTTAQKCIRTVDIEEVGDESHLTFFEMLGNFSFGDYFKKEAIDQAWEFLISEQWLGLDPKLICCTVFKEDQEAFDYWATYWKKAGFKPEFKIFKLGEETNYWPAGAFSSGPPGPCGPNSEIFYWTGKGMPPEQGYTKEDYLQDEKQGKWLEIWNLVFIQYEWQGEQILNQKRYKKTGLTPLPFASIDTGMGLERTAAIISGHYSVYDTDVLRPIIKCIEDLASGVGYGHDIPRDKIFRIIADHARTACFCIADGVLPSNTGRGYVLRRLIRRAILKGRRILDIEKPFFFKTYEGVSQVLANHYHELLERKDVILETLLSEEKLFLKTLADGSSMLNDHLKKLKKGQILPGEVAFKLYDTYGFPLEVTQELCNESGIEIDMEDYDQALKEAQARSRNADGMDIVYTNDQTNFFEINSNSSSDKTIFIGYSQNQADAKIERIKLTLDQDGKCLNIFEICLDQTPFYAESGGQVGDQGVISNSNVKLKVIGTKKSNGLFWHLVEIPELEIEGKKPQEVSSLLKTTLMNAEVLAQVDNQRRLNTERNHTATHLLHAALRKILGKHVTQAGSLVGPEHLRFDFTHNKSMTVQEILKVEKIVNEQIWKNQLVQIHVDIPIEEARKKGAMALFGEKYGDKVRIVQINDFSIELCGGTHLPQTGHIGIFKILHESSAASGVRRIEALTATYAYEWFEKQSDILKESSSLLKTHPKELLLSIEKIIHQNQELNRCIQKLRAQNLSKHEEQIYQIGAIDLIVKQLKDADQKDATKVADQIIDIDANRVALVILNSDDKVTFICKVGPHALKSNIHAGNIIKELAKRAGGGGGGRSDFATAGAKNVSNLKEILDSIENIVSLQMSQTKI